MVIKDFRYILFETAKMETLEPEIVEYLTLKSKSTKSVYSSAYRSFMTFYQQKYATKNAFSHFLDRIFTELKKDQREQGRIIEIEFSEFINYLKAEGKSNNSIRLYIAAVQNFLKYKHVMVSTSFVGNLPPAGERKANGKHEWKIDQIKQFVEATKNYRDKAIIICMFQSGLAVKEICNLDYGDIQNEFENNVLPICLKLVREKTSVEFKTFFGRDATKYLRLYLATRKNLKPESPLFAKKRERGGEARISTGAIQQSFSEIAKNLSFIKQKKGSYSPARPHSLRSAFNSQLVNKIDGTLREFWMGHELGGVARAYLNMPTDELRKLYMVAEEYLKIEKTSRDELDEKSGQAKLPPEVEEKIKLFGSDVDRFRDELAKSKADYEDLTKKLECAVAYISLLKYEIDEKEQVELQEEFHKLCEEVNKTHPLAKKPDKEIIIKSAKQWKGNPSKYLDEVKD